MVIKDYTLPPNTVLVLKSVNPDMSAYGGFIWPTNGFIEAPDWSPTNNCGSGLHGWLWGVGNFSLAVKHQNAKWLVIEVEEVGLIDLNGKVKFKQGNVIYCGNSNEAFSLIRRVCEIVITSTTGNNSHSSTSGYYSHSSTSGNNSHSSTSGDYSDSSTTGDYSHSSTSGKSSIACCLGTNSRAKAGINGSLILTYPDGIRNRHVIGYVGENNIEANVWYEVSDGILVRCKEQD